MMEIKHSNYTVEIETPELYVDNESRNRSGHMSHAMAEFAPNCFIDFNSNCSAVLWDGHMPYGWVEYRISKDGGKTYGPVKDLPYALQSFYDGVHYISVEKAVACDNGRIVAFCLRNDATDPSCCEPWFTPTRIFSDDGGETWCEPDVYSQWRGRTYDAVYRDGVIYVLHLCNRNFLGKTEMHKYRIYTSQDNGKNFEEHCVVPIEPYGRGYGAMIFDQQGNLHVYAYNSEAEHKMDHAVSADLGETWTVEEPCYLAEGIRNPQIGYVDGVYILHGRSGGARGFVMYTSEDATHWDEGCYIIKKRDVGAFYSNNLPLKDEKGNFLLVQYSDSYQGNRVNVMHLKLRIHRPSKPSP